MFIFTFGHAFTHYPNVETKSFAGQKYEVYNDDGIKGISSVVSSLFWPLYWSIKVQE